MEKAYFNWSSGKDSAMALYYAMQSGKYEIPYLFTVIKKDSAQIAMHEISLDLLKRQAEAIGIPLCVLEYDRTAPDAEYKTAMHEQMARWKEEKISTALFGDLYLEDLRARREEDCKRQGIRAAFPLWGSDTKALLLAFIRLGFKSIVTCVDGSVLDKSFAGRIIDETFIRDLPPGVDICGENGEYHSFVFDGPIFHHPVEVKHIRTYFVDYPSEQDVRQNRYWYVELR